MRAVAAWATLLLLSCGSNEGGPGPSDGDLGGEDAGLSDTGPLDLGFVDGAVPNPVEVGTGVDGFVPLADGALIELSQGPQGGGRLMGFHIWGAVKVRGFAAQGGLGALSLSVACPIERRSGFRSGWSRCSPTAMP
jgi:hypothetical protein